MVVVDSEGLLATVTKLHEGRDCRIKQTVQRVRDSLDSKEMKILRLAHGKATVADALSKDNPAIHKLLNRVTSERRVVLPTHQEFELDSSEWT